MPRILPLEMKMLKKPAVIIVILLLSVQLLSACNLPKRQVDQAPTTVPPTAVIPQPTPTPLSNCANPYFPSTLGTTWTYSGSNSFSGSYTRTDTVSQSGSSSFNVDTSVSTIAYSVTYSCTPAGLTASDPVTQYAGALLSSPSSQVTVNLTSNSGLTLPANVKPGDTWQQSADFEASSPNLNINGRFIFNYTAVGMESVTVPAGTYDALRVDATIDILVSAFHVSAGTYTTSTWLAPDVGIVKSQGASHVSGMEFSDGMQLTGFTPGS